MSRHPERLLASSWRTPLTRALLGAFLVVAGALLLAGPSAHAHAHASDSGYTLSIQLANGPTYRYNDGDAPWFMLEVTPPSGVTADASLLSLSVNGHTATGGVLAHVGTSIDDTMATDWNWFTGGTFTAVAYYDQGGANATESSPLSFSIARAGSTTMCWVADSALKGAYTVGQPLPIIVDSRNNAGAGEGVDWQHATYTVKFTGPETVTEANLIPSSSNPIVTATVPAKVGNYGMSCTFNGTASYQPSTGESTIGSINVTLGKHVAGAQLYTNPTTLQADQSWQAYIVIQGAPGGPAPTGRLSISVGSTCLSRGTVTLGSDGTVLVNMGPVSTVCDLRHITVFYLGDFYYTSASFPFSRTNPPIPSAGGGSASSGSSSRHGSGSSAKATASPTPTALASPGLTPSTAPTAPVSNIAGSTTPDPAASTLWGGAWPQWALAGVLLVLLLAGGGGVFLRVQRRVKVPAGAASSLAGNTPEQVPGSPRDTTPVDTRPAGTDAPPGTE